jgi:hypothetical protein
MSLRDAAGRREALETYPVAPPSIALAMMAANLAHMRVSGLPLVLDHGGWTPFERQYVDHSTPNSREYYEIIDRLSRGEQP